VSLLERVESLASRLKELLNIKIKLFLNLLKDETLSERGSNSL
jgi:hypothetical protein